jgi:hypothetical protein
MDPGVERDREAAGFAPLAVDERRPCAAGARVGGGPGLAEEAPRPRRPMPSRCTTRYKEDSPIPKRSRIADVGVLVSAYSRAMSRSSSGLNLRRREPAGRVALAGARVGLSAEVSVVLN